jgi:flagellar hook-associated protein 3 FlgL
VRLSTSMIYQSGLRGILDQQNALFRTQEQLATGKRINRPSDDPVGAARLQEVQRAIDQQDVFVNNIERARQRLAVEENALSSAGNSIQRVRELAVQAATDSVDDDSRAMIARELRQRVDELLAFANAQDGDGQFIFAGASSGSKPFGLDNGTVTYLGDSVRREIAIGPGTTVADGDTGDSVFMRIRDGNGMVQAAPGAGNAGTGIIQLEGRTNPGQWPGVVHTIEFTDAETWEIRDDVGDLVAGPAAYVPGDSIEFAGVRLKIDGTPMTSVPRR